MKKRWIILISNILSLMLLLICLSGCKWLHNDEMGKYDDPWKYKQQKGGFYYYVDKWDFGEDAAVILGLVSEMKEREELVIPEALGGYPVRQIGASHSTGLGTGPTYYYGIRAKNTEKIVINHDCYLADFGIKQFEGDIIVNANVTIAGNMYRWYESSEKKEDGKYYAANNIQINVELEKYYRFELFCYEQANNVSYEAMGGNLKTFYTIVKDGCYLNLPHDPVREGYNFGGWFKDEECLKEWNFEEDIVEEDITLYAKWIEV
ncbi:MAG: InlB B-repeat-containing protein [Clostridia bacterium]|nr:InlB B-repeat-containing protein [Clostridia bacterium]